MGFPKSILNGRLVRWVRRHPMIITVAISTSIGLVYLWKTDRNYLTSVISMFGLGAVYLYCCKQTREKLSTNQAIIITGCDSGLGYSLALHCRELGASVIAGVLEIDGQGAKNLRNEDIFVRHLDITNRYSVARFTESVRVLLEEKNLVLRCLVNNAGVLIFGEFEWQTEDQIRTQVEVNFLGTMRITRELMPLIRADLSRIIVISSHCSIEPIPGVAAYGGTKAAIASWATAIRVELKKYGVKVVCFVPGSFTKDSNIFSMQNEHFDAMRSAMGKEAWNFYGDYFDRYAEYFRKMGGKVEPRKIQNTSIYEKFEGCLLDKYPSPVYTAQPWRYLFFHTLAKIVPSGIRDMLIEEFVSLPPWKEKQ